MNTSFVMYDIHVDIILPDKLNQKDACFIFNHNE